MWIYDSIIIIYEVVGFVHSFFEEVDLQEI